MEKIDQQDIEKSLNKLKESLAQLEKLCDAHTSRPTTHCCQRSDIELSQVFARGEEKFRVIGIADEPTVIVENIETGEQEHHVISSRNFSEFRKVEK